MEALPDADAAGRRAAEAPAAAVSAAPAARAVPAAAAVSAKTAHAGRFVRPAASEWRTALPIPSACTIGRRPMARSVGEVRDDLGPHQLDRLHDRLVGNLVRVHQAEQEVDARRLVLAARLDAFFGGAEHARVRVRQVLEAEQ